MRKFWCERIRDLTGQRFGKLTVLEIASHNPIKWKCQCDCGNYVEVASTSLLKELTQSCGCSKSRGETKIIQILQENKIPFEYQKTFSSCKIKDTQTKARFDFFIDNKYIVEYDGEQHFSYSDFGWNTKEHFERIKYRDFCKNQWCQENNIPLIRIPYTHYNDLKLEDLLLDTSSFVVKS